MRSAVKERRNMILATWKVKDFYKADANKVAEEIMSIGEEASPSDILDKARDESTELHKCFDWDDSVAAEKWRIFQARKIVGLLVISKNDENGSKIPSPIRVFHKTDSGYKPISLIVKNQDEYEKLVYRCGEELRAIKNKYSHLTEYEEIWELIK